MYQYSMTQWIVGNEDIERSMARLRKFGYDGIEFAAEAEMLDSSRLKALMQKYGLVCTSLCGIFTENRDLTAPAGEKAEEAVKEAAAKTAEKAKEAVEKTAEKAKTTATKTAAKAKSLHKEFQQQNNGTSIF